MPVTNWNYWLCV